jgi:hypothetical protein
MYDPHSRHRGRQLRRFVRITVRTFTNAALLRVQADGGGCKNHGIVIFTTPILDQAGKRPMAPSAVLKSTGFMPVRQ